MSETISVHCVVCDKMIGIVQYPSVAMGCKIYCGYSCFIVENEEVKKP